MKSLADTLKDLLAANGPEPEPDPLDIQADQALAGDDAAIRAICGGCDYFHGDQKHCQPHKVKAGWIEAPCAFAEARKHALEAEGKAETDMLTERQP